MEVLQDTSRKGGPFSSFPFLIFWWLVRGCDGGSRQRPDNRGALLSAWDGLLLEFFYMKHTVFCLVKTAGIFVCYMEPNLILTDASFIHRHLLITYWTSGLVLSPGVIKMSELAKAYSGKRIQINKIHIIQ